MSNYELAKKLRAMAAEGHCDEVWRNELKHAANRLDSIHIENVRQSEELQAAEKVCEVANLIFAKEHPLLEDIKPWIVTLGAALTVWYAVKLKGKKAGVESGSGL